MAVRKVIKAGDKRLKTKNREIKDFKSPKLKELLKDLKDTIHKVDLVGIAAPQIAENYKVFITHPRETKARKLPRGDVYRVYINPKITYSSKVKSVIYEGCGSVGKLFGPVTRSKEVIVEAYDEKGGRFSLHCNGILARIIQHEMDHLESIEFIQKVDDYSKLMVEEHYLKKIKNSSKQLRASRITKIAYKKY